MDNFVFDGVAASDYGVKMQSPFWLDAPSPSNAYNQKIAGRNGNLVEWDGSYQNRDGEASCVIVDRDGCDKFTTFVSSIFQNSGYRRLTVDSMPDVYLMAMIVSGGEYQFVKKMLNTFTIKFSCKPQKWLLSGEDATAFSKSGTLKNPTLFPAKPIITVTGTGAGNLTIGGTTVEIKSLDSALILDCEQQTAYSKSGDSAAENKNSTIYAPEFPVLSPGNNAVSWTGKITKISIVPRWWTL